MRKAMLAGLCPLLLLAGPAMSEKFYGELVNAASGAALPAAFEVTGEETLSYCYNDLETSCSDLAYERLAGDVIEARLEITRKAADGTETRQTNIWTWSPIKGGYHGVFSIRYGDGRPEMKTQGDFFPKE